MDTISTISLRHLLKIKHSYILATKVKIETHNHKKKEMRKCLWLTTLSYYSNNLITKYQFSNNSTWIRSRPSTFQLTLTVSKSRSLTNNPKVCMMRQFNNRISKVKSQIMTQTWNTNGDFLATQQVTRNNNNKTFTNNSNWTKALAPIKTTCHCNNSNRWWGSLNSKLTVWELDHQQTSHQVRAKVKELRTRNNSPLCIRNKCPRCPREAVLMVTRQWTHRFSNSCKSKLHL